MVKIFLGSVFKSETVRELGNSHSQSMTKLQLGQHGQVFSCYNWSNNSRLAFDQCVSQLTNFDLDQDLTNLWPRYDYDVSHIFCKKYTIKWPCYDQHMTKIWPRILGESCEWCINGFLPKKKTDVLLFSHITGHTENFWRFRLFIPLSWSRSLRSEQTWPL